MDEFVNISKAKVNTNAAGKSKNPYKYNPNPIPQARERQVDLWRDKRKAERILAPIHGSSEDALRRTSHKALTKHVLNTLKDTSNPITHSTVGQRSDHVDSCVTGHQRSDRRGPLAAYVKSRNTKLEEQRLEKGVDANGVLKGVKVYIGGYMSGTTDLEMKRIVTKAGGRIMYAAAGATHILTSQGLSGSKTHKQLHTHPKNRVHIVRPEWVLDSIAAGMRKKEWDYTYIKDLTVYRLEVFGAGPPDEN